jgi:hypothetical protein
VDVPEGTAGPDAILLGGGNVLPPHPGTEIDAGAVGNVAKGDATDATDGSGEAGVPPQGAMVRSDGPLTSVNLAAWRLAVAGLLLFVGAALVAFGLIAGRAQRTAVLSRVMGFVARPRPMGPRAAAFLAGRTRRRLHR